MEYTISKETAHQIAVGLYWQVGEFVAIAKRENPVEYESFKEEYLARQIAPVKRRRTYRRAAVSR